MQMGNDDEMEMMNDIFVEQAKIYDELLFKKGERDNDIEQSLMHFITKDDLEVMKTKNPQKKHHTV